MVLVVCILAFHRDLSVPVLNDTKDFIKFIRDPRVSQVYARVSRQVC